MFDYIKKHYRGELPLEMSYWVNTIILSVIFNLITFIGIDSIDVTQNTTFWMLFIALYFIFIYLVVSPWMYIGLWRSADKHIQKYGVRFWANVVKILLIVGVFKTALSFYGVGLPIIQEFFKIVTKQDSIPSYQIEVYNENEIEILGGINYGLSRDFKAYLQQYPNIKTVRINSVGGRTVEATKIANMIREKALDTYAFGNCFSACTYIFVAGKKRTVEYGAVLGFHKPTLKGISEGELDQMIESSKKLFYANQIDRDFVQKAFNTPNNTLWRPSYQELKEANVITDIVVANSDRFLNMNTEALKKYLQYYPTFAPLLDMEPQKIIERVAMEINPSLPRLVDRITRQDRVEAKKEKMVYTYTILRAIKTKENFEKEMQKNLTKQICGDAFTLYLERKGISFEHTYNDRNGSNIVTILVDSCDEIKLQ